MAKATKDSYNRVYTDDSTYHYLEVPANNLQTKGEEYFQAVEITGINEDTGKVKSFINVGIP